jgi:hypothetical protein
MDMWSAVNLELAVNIILASNDLLIATLRIFRGYFNIWRYAKAHNRKINKNWRDVFVLRVLQ